MPFDILRRCQYFAHVSVATTIESSLLCPVFTFSLQTPLFNRNVRLLTYVRNPPIISLIVFVLEVKLRLDVRENFNFSDQ